MLKINSMNYNGSGESLDENDQVLASLNFNADSYSNYYFGLTFNNLDMIDSNIVRADFIEFQNKAAEVIRAGEAAGEDE